MKWGCEQQGEDMPLRDIFWAEFGELSQEKQSQLLWDWFGDAILDIVKNWDDEVVEETIKKLEQIKREENDNR